MPRKAKTKVEEDEVEQLSNKELKEKLSSMGINVGPIVGRISRWKHHFQAFLDSTRKIYERKLAKLLSNGKETAYSTDEDGKPGVASIWFLMIISGAPETPVVEDQKEEKKRSVRTKKSAKKVEEQAKDKFSDDEEEWVQLIFYCS